MDPTESTPIIGVALAPTIAIGGMLTAAREALAPTSQCADKAIGQPNP